MHALPLYHSAQMHVFLIPLLAIGAHNIVVPTPVPDQLLALFEEREINSFFAAPTVWVALANSSDLDTRNLESLRKAYYGASIMPRPVLAEATAASAQARLLQLLRPVRDGSAVHGPQAGGTR